MIADGHLDQLIDDIAQLASALLDAEPAGSGSSAAATGALDLPLQQLEIGCTRQSLQGAAYVLRLLRKVEPLRKPGPLSPSDAERVTGWIGSLTAYVMGQCDATDSAVVLDDLLPLSWVPKLPDDLIHLVRERLARDAARSGPLPRQPQAVAPAFAAVAAAPCAPGVIEAVAVNDDAPPPPAQIAAQSALAGATDDEPALVPAEETPVSWVGPEELELMTEAVSTQLLPLAANIEAQDSLAGQQQALLEYREQFDLISAASDALNLAGLRGVCAAFAAAQDQFAAGSALLRPEQLNLLGEWPLLLIGYLQAPTDAAAAADLVALFNVPGADWSLDESAAQLLGQQLIQVAIGLDPALISARKTIAEPADVRLDIADDVLPTVLAGMLLELPGRSAEFSACIQRFVRTGTAADLESARRIAHTLKGDGNIVGVRGIANLTHALEEILIDLAEAPGIPPPELGEVLVESADCLDAMSDFVLKRGPAPVNAVEVLQSVLNWANALHGAPGGEVPQQRAVAAEAPAAAEATTAPGPAAAEVEEPAEPESDQVISVPARLLDQLLRLTGEAVIYARQIENRVERIGLRATEIAVQNQSLQGLVSELQQLVEVRGAAVGSMRLTLGEEFDALEMDRYNELHTVTLRLVEASADARTTSSDVSQDVVGLRDLLSLQDRIHLDLQGRVLRTRTLPVANLLPRLQRVVRQTARQLGKDCEIEFVGETVELDHEIIERLAEPMVHMLRNAVDHGIEYPEHRVEQGKPYRGLIELSFHRDAGVVRIRCRDDGSGLDIEAIRRKGVERGLISVDQVLSDEQITQLIFRPGFSTRSVATHTSGRGIGMDIVHRCIAQLKGSLVLHSEPGKGCEFEIQLPASQVVADVLLTYTSAAPVAIMLHGVERLAALERGGLAERAGELIASLGELSVAAYSLEALLGYPAPPIQPGEAHTALVTKMESGSSSAVLVGRVGEARSVIVKNLGTRVPPIPGVLGATILGDGSVAPVVDLQALIGIRRRASQGFAETASEVVNTAPHVLVVDDSLSVRRSLEQLVGDAGFDVVTARDGLEAVERVQARRPDLVLVDMEMPRMNGLELTSFIRKNESTRSVPVIMITSRTTERHRELARHVGVDTILSKPYSEEDLLKLIERRIGAQA